MLAIEGTSDSDPIPSCLIFISCYSKVKLRPVCVPPPVRRLAYSTLAILSEIKVVSHGFAFHDNTS